MSRAKILTIIMSAIASLVLHWLVWFNLPHITTTTAGTTDQIKVSILTKRPQVNPKSSEKSPGSAPVEKIAKRRSNDKGQKDVTKSLPSGSTNSPVQPKKQKINPGRGYQSLFPEVSELGQVSTSDGPELSAGEATELSHVGNLIGLKLDIPLVFRKVQRSGKAWLTLRLVKDEIYIVVLDGDPLIRAVLLETITESKNIEELQRAFALLDRKEIKIYLNFGVRKNLVFETRDEVTFNHRKNRFTFNITRWVAGKMDGSIPEKGMPLPDREAKRAIARDKGRLRVLRMSPAHIAPIRNRKLRSLIGS